MSKKITIDDRIDFLIEWYKEYPEIPLHKSNISREFLEKYGLIEKTTNSLFRRARRYSSALEKKQKNFLQNNLKDVQKEE